MRTSQPLVQVWRLVFEAATPLSMGSGRGDGIADVVLCRDFNGLPLLPASSLAGVMRAAMAADLGPAAAQAAFGHAAGDSGQISAFEFSHGRIHDSRDRPIEALLAQVTDPLLAPLTHRSPLQRERVRIGHRGVVDDQAYFDRAVLAAGHRFSVEVMLWSGEDATPAARWLATLLGSRSLRVGAQTRSGLGRLDVVRAWTRAFDLRRAADLQAFTALGRGLVDHDGLEPVAFEPAARSGVRRLHVRLWSEGGFRFGAGRISLLGRDADTLADDLPMTEPRVAWSDGRGAMQRPQDAAALAPATGIKGAISHRVAFHARRFSRAWADDSLARAAPDAAPAIRRLFGAAADERRDRGAPSGQAGVLTFDDVVIPRERLRAQQRVHNSIDRFTGGVREHLLFTTEDLYAADERQPTIEFDISLDLGRAARVGVTAGDLDALEAAVGDLCRGALTLGADGAGGHGFFRGEHRWCGDGRRPELTPAAGSSAATPSSTTADAGDRS